MSPVFRFKQFDINDDGCSMKISTDGVLLGAWVSTSDVEKILDIGTGCGLIAMILAQRSDAVIDGIDIHEPSILMARKNGLNTPWNSKLKFYHQSLQDFAKNHKNHYDLIVSNPPYFESSLVSPDPKKALAKHTGALNHDELVFYSISLLKPGGKISLVLPAGILPSIKTKFAVHGFAPSRIAMVKGKHGKEYNRTLVEMTFSEDRESVISDITIRDKNGHFTPAYKALTSEYYLDF